MTESGSAERRQIERRERDEPVPVERRKALRRRRDKVACPHCGSLQSIVLPYAPTPQQSASGIFWRLRRCECLRTYHTCEAVAVTSSK